MAANDEEGLVGQGKKALRNAAELEVPDPRSLTKEPAKRHTFKAGGMAGAGAGLALGMVLLAGARLVGIPLGNAESVFIVAQFSLLGGLMTYINS